MNNTNYRSNFKPVTNQRSIKVNKTSCNENELYAKININAMDNAMRDLKPTAFKLWLYFAKNQDKYEFYLSAVHACHTCGFGQTAYHKAFDELVDKYYLLRDSINRDFYNFYEIPQENPNERIIKVAINKA